MVNSLRLYYFDFSQGNKTAVKLLINRFGLKDALALALKLQWTLVTDNPFKTLNRKNKPTEQQKLSQRQMAPVVVLFQLLQEKGLSKQQSLEVLRELIGEVATEFLKFNVPVIQKESYSNKPYAEKLSVLGKVTGRFFNAEAELTLDENDNFKFNVTRCHFANYCRKLNVPELGPLFCSADKRFFDDYQKDIVFFRSKTIAGGDGCCDFTFSWEDS